MDGRYCLFLLLHVVVDIVVAVAVVAEPEYHLVRGIVVHSVSND